jgi:serine/threonine protein kinase/DNA-binding SARP family transcriptional activator/WD40 repeat protein
MQVRVLGTIEVLEPPGVALGGPTQRRVLSTLLMNADRVVSVDQLVDAVWPERDVPERAEHNVRTYVHRLRTALDGAGERIETAGTGYRLRLQRDELDATRFEDLVAAARVAMAAEQLDRTQELLDEAFELWAGRPYDEFADEEWARAEVVRLREVRASALEHRFAALLDAGRHTEVVGPLQEAVTEEPWREARRMQLALALYRSGRQAEALRSIQRYRAELVDELGLEASTELDQLEHQILEHDPALLPASHQQHRLRGYQLDEVIGEGAFSLVWRGVQPSLGRTVAVKQIRAELANQSNFVRRFEAEAQTVAALEHPHIVPLYDYWREPDSAYLVMRYVAGGSLESEVLDRGLDEARLRRFVAQVGSALQTAHRAGVIHRDMKSANVLLDDDDNFYLTDFGIAFTGSADDDELANALSTGSPAYASPEQLRRQALDNRTDIYAFGITLFEAATGRLPFVDAPTQAALVKRQLEDPVPAVSSVAPSAPAWVDEIVARATAKNPADRFGSMADLMAAVPEIASKVDIGRGVADATVIGELVNPFKALRAFREADTADFHGRNRLIARFVDVLSRPGSAGRMLAVVGPSGSGKSSAVRSGLLPRLRAGAVPRSQDWFVTTMLPGSHPFDELESALSRVSVRQPGPLVEMMRGDDRGIARAINQILPDEDTELFLVIDQFEEMFTLTGEGDRIRFLDGLLAALREPRARLRVALTIRADFWDRPLRHPGLAARMETAAVTVSPLAADELEAAIIEPVRRQGASYESGLVARIIADVGDQPGALPLLQYALTELFDTHVSGLIRAESYDAIGGLTGALAQRAEETLVAMSDGEQASARRLFGRLVTLGEGTEDTRRRVRVGELGDDPDTASVIDAFGAARLLVFDRDDLTREPTVEIAHEALLRAWPRLTGWLDDDRDRLRVHRHLTAASASWLASDRDDGELYRGGRLESAEAQLAGSAALNDIEQEFLRASITQRDREAAADRMRRRRLQRLVTVAAMIAVLALVAGTVALIQWRHATDQAAQKDRAQAAALGRALVRDAEASVERDPELAQLLAIESAAQFRRAGSGVPPAVSQALRDGIVTSRVRGRVPGGYFVAVDTAGETMATPDTAGGVALWDVESLALVDTTDRPADGDVVRAWFDGATGGLRAMIGSGAGTVDDPERADVVAWDSSDRVWEAALTEPLVAHGGLFYDGSVDPVSGMVALVDGGVRIVEADGDVVEVDLPDRENGVDVTAVALSQGRVAYAVSSDPPSLRMRSIGSDQDDDVVEQLPMANVFKMALDEAGRRVAITDGDSVAVVDLARGVLLWQPVALSRAANVAWLADGERLAVGGETMMTIVDAGTGEVLDRVAGHSGGSDQVVAVPGSDLVFSAGLADEQTLLFDLSAVVDQPFPTLESPRETIMLAVAPDGGRLLVRHRQDITVLDPTSGEVLLSTLGLEYRSFNDVRDVNTFTFAVWSRDLEHIAAPDADGRSVLMSADGATLWTAPDGWDIRGMSDDGTQVVIHRTGVGNRLVDVSSGDAIELPPHPVVNLARFSPDGRYVSLNTDDIDIDIVSTTDGTPVATIETTSEFPTGLWHDYSPDGSLVAVGTDGGDVLIYDLDDLIAGVDQGEALRTRIAAHDSLIVPLVFSPDGTLIATVGRGNEPARIWRVDTGELVAEFGTPETRTAIAFHPTEPWVYVGEGTTITRHTLDVDELITIAKANLTRNLSDDECRQYLERACAPPDQRA